MLVNLALYAWPLLVHTSTCGPKELTEQIVRDEFRDLRNVSCLSQS